MNEIEKEMFLNLYGYTIEEATEDKMESVEEFKGHATVAARVAKRYIEKAFIEGYYAIAGFTKEEAESEDTTGAYLAKKYLASLFPNKEVKE